MASWNEIKNDMGNLASKAIKKTGELADSASVAIKIKVEQVKLSSAYEALGKLTYKQLKTSESQAEKISEAISLIDSLHENIRSLRQKAEELKKEREEKKAEQDTVLDNSNIEDSPAEE